MIWLELAVVLLLVLLNGVFAMSELAVVSSSRPRLKILAKRGSRGAAAALALAEDPSRFLSTVQVGITLIGIVAGTFGGATLSRHLAERLDAVALIAPHGEPIAFVLVVVFITYLSLIAGELVPKQLALHNPERIAVFVARPMQALSRFGSPVIKLLQHSSNFLLRLIGGHHRPAQGVTEEEVREVIAEGARVGVLKKLEQQMLTGVMRFADWRVELVMTDRDDVVWIDLDDDRATLRERILAIPFSRIVATRGGLGNVLGVLLVKNLLDRCLLGLDPDIESLLVVPPTVPRNLPATEALAVLRDAPTHLLFVRDERGEFEGIVTVTDIVKAIVGGLSEHGRESPRLARHGDGSWLVDGDLLVDILADEIGLAGLPAERDFDSVAGLVLWRLERLPEEGEHVDYEGFRFQVLDMDGHRIDKVRVARIGDAYTGDEGLEGG